MDPFGQERVDDVSRTVLPRGHVGRRTRERKAGANEPGCSATLAAHRSLSSEMILLLEHTSSTSTACPFPGVGRQRLTLVSLDLAEVYLAQRRRSRPALTLLGTRVRHRGRLREHSLVDQAHLFRNGHGTDRCEQFFRIDSVGRDGFQELRRPAEKALQGVDLVRRTLPRLRQAAHQHGVHGLWEATRLPGIRPLEVEGKRLESALDDGAATEGGAPAMGPRPARLEGSSMRGYHPNRSRLTWHCNPPHAGRPILPLQCSRAAPPDLAAAPHKDLEPRTRCDHEATSKVVADSRPTLLSRPARPCPSGLARPSHGTRIPRGKRTIGATMASLSAAAADSCRSALARPPAVRRSASGSSRSVRNVWSSCWGGGRALSRSALPSRRTRF